MHSKYKRQRWRNRFVNGVRHDTFFGGGYRRRSPFASNLGFSVNPSSPTKATLLYFCKYYYSYLTPAQAFAVQTFATNGRAVNTVNVENSSTATCRESPSHSNVITIREPRMLERKQYKSIYNKYKNTLQQHKKSAYTCPAAKRQHKLQMSTVR